MLHDIPKIFMSKNCNKFCSVHRTQLSTMVTESVKKQNLVKANVRQKLSTTFPPRFTQACTQVMRARVYITGGSSGGGVAGVATPLNFQKNSGHLRGPCGTCLESGPTPFT